MSTVRIGIVGAGNIATNAHMPAYTHCADAQVVAVADIDFQRAKDFAERFHLEAAYSSVEEMLDKSDIDAVDVCVWNCAHAEVSIAALRAGKAVLCEKPLSYDLESALQIQEEVKKAGVPFCWGFPTGFYPANHLARQLVEAGELGGYLLRQSFLSPPPRHAVGVVYRPPGFRWRTGAGYRCASYRRGMVSGWGIPSRCGLARRYPTVWGIPDKRCGPLAGNALSGRAVRYGRLRRRCHSF